MMLHDIILIFIHYLDRVYLYIYFLEIVIVNNNNNNKKKTQVAELKCVFTSKVSHHINNGH